MDEQRPEQTGGIVHDPTEYQQTTTAEPAAEVVEEAVNEEEPQVEESKPAFDPFAWQASEFIHHQKQSTWYVLLFLIAAVLIGGAVWTQQWFTVAVFAVMTIALAIYAHKPPRTLLYELTEHGLTIDGKLFNFSQFRDFAVIEDIAWHSIDLEPVQRFMPRLTILFDSKDFDHIVEILGSQLPRVDRAPDLIERFTRKIRF
jgi:hypothetical protein